MKTLADLFAIIALAVEKTNRSFNKSDFFADYAGHVNSIHLRYFLTGWKSQEEGGSDPQKFETYLTDEGIQAAYWWVKTTVLS